MTLAEQTADTVLDMFLPTAENVAELEDGQRYVVLVPELRRSHSNNVGRIEFLRFERYTTVPCKFVDTDGYPYTKYTMDKIICFFKLKEKDGN